MDQTVVFDELIWHFDMFTLAFVWEGLGMDFHIWCYLFLSLLFHVLDIVYISICLVVYLSIFNAGIFRVDFRNKIVGKGMNKNIISQAKIHHLRFSLHVLNRVTTNLMKLFISTFIFLPPGIESYIPCPTGMCNISGNFLSCLWTLGYILPHRRILGYTFDQIVLFLAEWSPHSNPHFCSFFVAFYFLSSKLYIIWIDLFFGLFNDEESHLEIKSIWYFNSTKPSFFIISIFFLFIPERQYMS